MLDLAIRGGALVDGTGAPARRADVGVRGGRIAAVGRLTEGARETVDASGCTVAPGFVDPHTHLDAQLCWDPTAAPTSLHGVTSVAIGLCGFGIAPCPEGGGDYLLRSLEVVEEIPFESSSLGVEFRWRSWAEFFEHLGRQDLRVNVAGFVPHSALRYFAMGERARSERASADDRARLRAELERSLSAGALGLASSRGPNHKDAFGEPVPSRFADDAELRELVGACRGRPWQINVEAKFGRDAEALLAEVDRYAEWTAEAGARLSWTPFHAEPGSRVWEQVLAHNRALNARGIPVAPQVAPQPISVVFRFDAFSYVAFVRGWAEALKGFFELDAPAKLARLGDPALRAALRAAPEDPMAIFAPSYRDWLLLRSPSRPELVGRCLADVGAALELAPSDALCELLLADALETRVQVPAANRDRAAAARLSAEDSTLIGLGDSGAHVTSINNYSYPTVVLSELVRDREALSLERAVHRMTAHPADFLGLAGRGRVQPGAAADLVVFDLARLAPGPLEFARDLPGGAPRLFQGAQGYVAVLVNGEVSLRDDAPAGRAAGQLLRAAAG